LEFGLEVNIVRCLFGQIRLDVPDPLCFRIEDEDRHEGGRPGSPLSGLAEEGPLAVLADAAIHNAGNFPSERSAQRSRGASLVAQLWAQHGDATPGLLLGDFAFAVLDRRNRALHLVRDHIGTKSLYWKQEGALITIGSCIEEVIATRRTTASIDEASVVDYLASPYHPLSSGTFFSDVQAVPAGCIVELNAARARTRRWWNPTARTSVRLPKPAAYADAMRELVDGAVQDRMAGARAVGAHVSGGIDSTGIGVIAARKLGLRGDALRGAYTWSPAVSALHPEIVLHDERRRVLAAAGDVPVRFGAADEHNFLAFLERPMELEGIADLPDEIPMLEIAARDGVDVMLSGWGGDEAFSSHGFGYLAQLITSFQPMRAARFARSQLRTLRNLGPLASLLWYQGIYPMLPAALYQRLSPYRDMGPTASFMSASLKQRYRHEIVARREQLRFGPNAAENIKRHLFYGHIGMRMETWASWSRPFGFEYRYPLTDRRILEFVMTIPPEALFLGDRPRGLALAALADTLPPNIMKHDAANERLRRTTRYRAWLLITERTRRGEWLHDDCPWLDMPALRACAMAPLPQDTDAGVIAFAELFTALRVWHMYRRSQRW
jgi:asparagine synthase (glutamine-hydrolysing)